MNDKKFSIIILCVLYGCVLSLALINFVVDPYQVFGTPFFKLQGQVNDRYLKIEFLKKRKERYNSYIMGSSRMLHTIPDSIVKYLPGAKFYNLATTLATPFEHLLHLKYFIKNEYPVRNLYIGLDVDFCFGAKMHKDRDLLLKLHPAVLNKNLISHYWSYLIVFPKTDIRRKLRLNFSRTASAAQDEGPAPKAGPLQIFEKDGAWAWGEETENAKVFFEDPANQDHLTIKNEVREENVEGLKELVALCRQHEINLILFITPHGKYFMDRFAMEDYLAFLKKLSDITAFWDFSGYNSVTTNNKNYLDRSHYKSSVSRMIAARIFNDKTLTIPEDFGVWVTKESIDSHLENLRRGMMRNRPGGNSQDLGTQTKAASGGLR